MLAEFRHIRIELANLEQQVEDLIAQSKQIHEHEKQLEQEVVELKKQLQENGNK